MTCCRWARPASHCGLQEVATPESPCAMQPYGGLSPSQAWLAPQPGGSVFWSLGYYPAGVRGVGGGGVMFVLSTEDWFGGTW